MKKTLKADAYELSIELSDPTFVRPPLDSQRELLLQSALEEWSRELRALHTRAATYVQGSSRPVIQGDATQSTARYGAGQLVIAGQQVMQDWEHPYMKALADAVTETRGDILEVGFGMGISASYIQEHGPASYTVIECNPDVRDQFERWKRGRPGKDIRLVFGRWQDVIESLGSFDGILYDIYPLTEEEVLEAYSPESDCSVAPFFPAAAKHLKPGGTFTYYTSEADSLGRGHQRQLLDHFDGFTVTLCRNLQPPSECQYWWAHSMAVVKAFKKPARASTG
jgi:guanidinoacetate N-methyltransferase